MVVRIKVNQYWLYRNLKYSNIKHFFQSVSLIEFCTSTHNLENVYILAQMRFVSVIPTKSDVSKTIK